MQLKNITKTYGNNNVLDHIDFDFGQSQIVGLIGKNGVGKTTLMKVMNGNIINYKGDVKLGNKQNVGYLIEHPKLYDNKTGLFNLKLFANVLGNGFDKKYADQIIDAFGMRPYVKKKVKKYS
ncbi:ATP-binding cassette domain-containing protein, partial [Staphylococcus saprophyticus]